MKKPSALLSRLLEIVAEQAEIEDINFIGVLVTYNKAKKSAKSQHPVICTKVTWVLGPDKELGVAIGEAALDLVCEATKTVRAAATDCL
jgi:hypothetical protein